MATLNIRNLPDDVHHRLRMRAAEHGRSMEAEVRVILTEACLSGRKSRATAAEATAKPHDCKRSSTSSMAGRNLTIWSTT